MEDVLTFLRQDPSAGSFVALATLVAIILAVIGKVALYFVDPRRFQRAIVASLLKLQNIKESTQRKLDDLAKNNPALAAEIDRGKVTLKACSHQPPLTPTITLHYECGASIFSIRLQVFPALLGIAKSLADEYEDVASGRVKVVVTPTGVANTFRPFTTPSNASLVNPT